MKLCYYLKVELNRLLHSKATYLISILTILCPLLGYNLYMTIGIYTVSDRLISNPAMAGAICGGILFALFTILEFNQIRKNHLEALINSAISSVTLNIVRLLSIMLVAILNVTLTAIIYFPYTYSQMGNIFDMFTYLSGFYTLMLGSILLAILIASAFYQFFYRVDVSFVAFIAFMSLSMSHFFYDDYILRWINPILPPLTDNFSNGMGFRLMRYNRLFWFLVLLGLWLFSMLCIRKYKKNILGSFLYNSKKIYILFLASALIFSGCYAYTNQPYIDHSPHELNYKQRIPNQKLLLSNTKLDISFNTKNETLWGKAVYLLQNSSGCVQGCKLYINPGYTISSIIANGTALFFRDLKNDTDNAKNITFTIPKSHKINLSIKYYGKPKIWSFFRVMLTSPTNIDSKYINIRSSELYPMLDVADNLKGTNLTGKFTLPKELTPVTNGDVLKLISKNSDSTKTWFVHNKGNKIFLFAGDYVTEKFNVCGMPVEFYYSRKLQSNLKKLKATKIMKYALSYNTSHFGMLKYVIPKQPIKIVEITAVMPGGGQIDNLSFVTESCFSDDALNDRQDGASKAEVLAHELTHQWWNSQVYDEKNTTWTQEGITTYVTYRMAKEKYGKAYAKRNYFDKWKKQYEQLKQGFYNRNPKYLKILPSKYVTELTSNNDAINSYNTIPLKICKAANLIGGEEKMDKLLAKLYRNSGTDSHPYITYNEFLKACGLKEEDLTLD